MTELACELESFVYNEREGGHTAYRECIDNSIRFLEELDEKTRNRVQRWHMSAMEHGTVVINIERGRDLVSVELGMTKMGFYTKFKDGFNQEVPGEPYGDRIITKNLNIALDYIRR